jgi:hypothetical protein
MYRVHITYTHRCVVIINAVPLHATEALGGKEVQLLLILDLGTRWRGVSGQRYTPAAL